MMKTQKQTLNPAFTLVETMVAVVILGMAIAAMHSTWMAILGATKSGARAAAQIQRERVALSTMELALNCSIIYFNENRQNQGLTNAYSFVVEDIDGFKSVSFVARLPADFLGSSRFPHQPIRRVTLAVEPTQSGQNNLVMRQWQLTKMERAMEEGDKGLGVTLARDVDLFEVRFWSSIAEDYVDYWDEPEVLPRRVRLFLALRDEDGEEAAAEALSMREFALVSDVIVEDMISPDPPPATSRGRSGRGGSSSGGGGIDWSKLPKGIRDRIDTNKDGRLSDSEKRRAEEYMKKRNQGSSRSSSRVTARPSVPGNPKNFRSPGPGSSSSSKK